MNALDIITDEIPPLKITDNGEKALRWMDEFRVSHLPVLDGNNYKGLISDNEILDLNDPSVPFKDLNITLARPYIKENAHIYEAMRLIADFKITVVPILNDEEQYVGSTNIIYMMSLIAEIGSIKEAGGIIILTMNQIDYSLAEIAQIVESNNAKILSSYITSGVDSTEMEVTLKINKSNLDSILRTFERYEYNVKASYQKSKYQDDLKNRYDELMNYLKL